MGLLAGGHLNGLELLGNLLELGLCAAVLGLELLVLLLPVLDGGLEGDDLALKVLGLDVGESQLLGGLAQVVVGLLELFLKERDLLCEGLVGRAVGGAFLGGSLGVGELSFQLLDLGLKQTVLVGEAGDLLVLAEVVGLKNLDLLLGLFGLFLGSLGLELEGVDFL